MASTLTSNLQTGGVQFQTALRNSQNAVSSLLRQAGVIMPGGGAAGGIGGAFDPYNVVGGQAFDASSLTGTGYGSEGAYSEAYQAGGNIAAEQAMQLRSRGLGGGGLAAQRQELALMQTQGGAAAVTKSLIEGIGTQYGVAQQADVDELQRQADKLTTDTNAAAAGGPIAATAPDTSVQSGKPKLSGGPSGDFMTKVKAGLHSNTNKDRQKIRTSLQEMYNTYELTAMQKNYIQKIFKRYNLTLEGGS